MAGKSGKKAQVKVSGAATAFTDEATTEVTADTVFQITDTAKRVWDRTATITVKVDTVTQASSLYTLNRLTGTVTFLSAIGAAAVVTVSGSYLPLSTAAEAKSYRYSVNGVVASKAAFGASWDTNLAGIKNVAGSLSEWHDPADTYFTDALVAGSPVVIEFWSNSAGAFDAKCWALLDSTGISAVLTGNVEESVSFVGTTDADGRTISG